MARLFPKWTDTAFKVVLGGLGAGAVGGLTLVMLYMRTPYGEAAEYPIDQPVQFDHRHHVEDDQIDCRYCHSGAERSSYAGIPATEVCMGCHNQVWNQSPMLEPVRRSYFSGEALEWNRVHHVPDFVYFNHSIHVNKGVGCVSCHGRVDQMALDYQVAPLTMGWCLDCHRNPEPNLRPQSQITSMTWTAEQDPKGHEQAVTEYNVRHLTNCTTCHR